MKADRPPAWEYFLFAGVLLRGKEGLALRWRDHQLAIPTGTYHRLSEEDVPGYFSEAFGRLSWIIDPIGRVFEAQDDAFGKPGEPGDPPLIEHFAEWIVSTYRQLLDWAGTIRSAGVPEGFETAVELLSHAADKPIEDIRTFIDDVVAELDQLPDQLKRQEPESEPIQIGLTLTLTADDDLMNEGVAELRKAMAQSDI